MEPRRSEGNRSNANGLAFSQPVSFTVKAAKGHTVYSETNVVFSTGLATNLNVLANDTTPGFYRFQAVAFENENHTNTSAPITVNYNPSTTTNLVADITNLSNPADTNITLVSFSHPVIRDGFFNLAGQVYDPGLTNSSTRDPAIVSYAVFWCRPNDSETPVGQSDPGNAQGPPSTAMSPLPSSKAGRL